MGVSIICPCCHSRMTMQSLRFDGCSYINNSIPYNFLERRRYNGEYHNLIQILYKCGNKGCNSMIIADYIDNEDGEPVKVYPYRPKSFDFSSFPNISNLSKDFISIFNQAYCAEQNGYKIIAGPGYRKAFEYLIKDYIISFNENEKDKISKMNITDCIENYINDDTFKEHSKYAIWLGNDQVHYYQKREDKDLEYLKKLLITLMSYIEMQLNLSSFSADFSEKKS